MKKRICAIALAVCLLLLNAGGAWAQIDPASISAQSAILIEPNTGQVLFEKNADEKREIASVTKIMAILLVMEALDRGEITLQDQVRVSEYASSMGGSQVFLWPDETLPLYALLKATIVASANDADVALAEHIAGSYSAFVERMNNRAAELGMVNTRFANSTGLPSETPQYSTARDVSIMAAELVKHPVFFEYSTIWFENLSEARNNTEIANTNKLVRDYQGCDGIKTGYTEAAGHCLAATAKKGNTRYISVVLGAPSSKERFSESAMLLDYGFSHFETVKVMDDATMVQTGIPVKNGKEEFLNGLVKGDMVILKPLTHEPQLEKQVTINPVEAPVQEGQEIGEILFLMDGKNVGTLPIIADRSIEKAGYRDYLNKILGSWMGYPKKVQDNTPQQPDGQ
jgi:D-alanyl-D-alanine carboxypeptidase (penicillin-binding protein 5/6)